MYGFYFDKHGFIHTTRFNAGDELAIGSRDGGRQGKVEKREPATWLKFIVIFWSPRVLKAAVKFGLAAMIMNKYERIGFAVMMLCFAF